MFDVYAYHLFDGAMGTSLQKRGLAVGQCPEKLVLTDPQLLLDVHRSFLAAGADVLTTNTFGASLQKMGEDPAPYVRAAVALAKEAAGDTGAAVALDIGPLGGLLRPFGDMTFEDAYDQFVHIVEAGEEAGADLVLVETMSDILEAKAALLAAKEHCDLPVVVTMTYGEDGRTFLGTDPGAATVALTALGADAVGVNCSLGPKELLPIVETILASTHLPVIVQPNAGLPRLENGETVFDVAPEEFALWAEKFLAAGASMLGGCCGTTPEHIRAMSALMKGRTPQRRERSSLCRLCGWQGTLELGPRSIATVGERINPTGRKKLKDALYTKNYDYVAELAIKETAEGADLLVVNAGLPDIDEEEALPAMVQTIQGVSPLPLVLDCSDPKALEKAIRVCRGRPILNSVNGDPESMANMLPLAKKYGTGLVVLALDQSGVSDAPEERCAAAFRVAEAAEDMGIRREDLFLDCLSMAASVGVDSAMATPKAIAMAREAGYKTILGVSNVSHGLPGRTPLNCAYLSLCMAAGLNVAIVNTGIPAVMDTIAAGRLLAGQDPGCGEYIARFQGTSSAAPQSSEEETLQSLIISGQKAKTGPEAAELLKKLTPLEVINDHIIPALDQVGEGYESGRLFLPQLMASAEAVKAAFGEVDRYMPQGGGDRGMIILATVKGDVHDIGKNIVKMLLENYGYKVIDLGRDVEADAVVKAALETKAPLVGLSSLMTTTAQNIAVTVKALREAGAVCKIMVGGAVVTPSFAQQIGADYYVKDAAQSAKVASEIFGQ